MLSDNDDQNLVLAGAAGVSLHDYMNWMCDSGSSVSPNTAALGPAVLRHLDGQLKNYPGDGIVQTVQKHLENYARCNAKSSSSE